MFLLAIALEWTEEYPGSVTKPVPVRWAGIVCKIIELGFGVVHWATRGNSYNWVFFFAKGVVVALEIPLKGGLIFKYVPRTTLSTPSDWFNLFGPTLLALCITIMDAVKLRLSIAGGDDGGEDNQFLPFTGTDDKYESLVKRPYPGAGLNRREKLVIIEALLYGV